MLEAENKLCSVIFKQGSPPKNIPQVDKLIDGDVPDQLEKKLICTMKHLVFWQDVGRG